MEHKNNCMCERCRQGKEERQFAVWRPTFDGKEVDILVDCEEISHIFRFIDKEIALEDIKVVDTADDKEPVLAYGILMICNGIEMSVDEAEETLNNRKNYAFACLEEMKECLSSYEDIAVFKEDVVYEDSIPIACLLKTDLDVANGKQYGFGYTMFIRYSDMDILSNIMNRNYLLCLRGVEESFDINDKDNWKDYINKDRLIKIAKELI